jgi:hypothetical protein
MYAAEFPAETKVQLFSQEFPLTRAMPSAMRTTKQGEIRITRLSGRRKLNWATRAIFMATRTLSRVWLRPCQRYVITLTIDRLKWRARRLLPVDQDFLQY